MAAADLQKATTARLLSVNVGLPRDLPYDGGTMRSSIFKDPVAGPVALGATNLEGDRQSSLEVHGGVDKAVYAYAHEYYAYWAERLDGAAFGFGQFGENFTVSGLLDDAVNIGDRFGVGTAVVEVTEPRIPCYKLAFRMGEGARFVTDFLAAGRLGFYLRVIEEGEVCAGDAITEIARREDSISVAVLARLAHDKVPDREALARAVAVPWLVEGWRARLQKRLEM